MPNPVVSYAPRPDVKPKDELNALAACYRLILDSTKKRGRLPDKSGPHDAILRNTKGGSHVGQRPG